ncbi:hypothetical protein [Eubacterium sp. AB3007]|nr:hypothetical protein [Eubacterium sp. AB3007]
MTQFEHRMLLICFGTCSGLLLGMVLITVDNKVHKFKARRKNGK